MTQSLTPETLDELERLEAAQRNGPLDSATERTHAFVMKLYPAAPALLSAARRYLEVAESPAGPMTHEMLSYLSAAIDGTNYALADDNVSLRDVAEILARRSAVVLAAAIGAARHLAEVEAELERLREAIDEIHLMTSYIISHSTGAQMTADLEEGPHIIAPTLQEVGTLVRRVGSVARAALGDAP